MQYYSYRLKIGATNKKFIEIEAGGAQLKGNSHPMFLRSCLYFVVEFFSFYLAVEPDLCCCISECFVPIPG